MNYSYQEFSQWALHQNYPAFIIDNLETIYRMILSLPRKKSVFRTLKYVLEKKLFLENQLISQWGPLKSPFSNRELSSKVLMLFTPYRRDLMDFLYPVANILAEQDDSVSLLIPCRGKTTFGGLSPKVKVIFKESMYGGFGVYQEARNYFYGELNNPVQAWCREIKATPQQKTLIKIFFKKFALDTIVTYKLLQLVKPKCVFGLHYILDPGCLNAIRKYKLQNSLHNLVIQHGFYITDHSKTHDFNGADTAILWGDYQQRYLQTMAQAPPAVVIGNPKLEASLKRLTKEQCLSPPLESLENRKIKLLFVSTKTLTNRAIDKKIFDTFIGATQELKNVEIIYKLHPSESRRDYRDYFAKGLIKPKQIILDQDLYPLLYNADIIVGSFSTAMFEALALGKPVIWISPHGNLNGLAGLELMQAADSGELVGLINKLSYDRAYRQEILAKEAVLNKDFFNHIDGSAERIAGYVASCLEKE